MNEERVFDIEQKSNLKNKRPISIIRIIFSVIFFTLSILIIIGSINVSRVERNYVSSKKEKLEKWNTDYETKKEYYNQLEDEYYEQFLKESDNFYYKYSYSEHDTETKVLKLEICFISFKELESFRSINFYLRKDEILKYSLQVESIRDYYILMVPVSFEIEDYKIYLTQVKIKNESSISSEIVTSYDDTIKQIKPSVIRDKIIKEIGVKPDFDEGEISERFFEYRLATTLMLVGSVILIVIGIVIIICGRHRGDDALDEYVEEEYESDDNYDDYEENNNYDNDNDYNNYDNEEEYDNDIVINDSVLEDIKQDIKEELLKEITVKVKKVECYHCGSKYKETLGECPYCGSAKIDNE